ncbi:MAG: LysR family transcriptional regulator [Proteobacteria bacterium]|nr:LysR family transcriptional regulator [Pseudomonadota bacterium]
MPVNPAVKLKLQIYCDHEIAMGPGKADLLDAIAAHGSISAAARAMGMSYRRAWLLVDAMNRCWSGPLVETLAGGGHERGARVSELGAEVLRQYRAMQTAAGQAAADRFDTPLAALLAPTPRPAQH